MLKGPGIFRGLYFPAIQRRTAAQTRAEGALFGKADRFCRWKGSGSNGIQP